MIKAGQMGITPEQMIEITSKDHAEDLKGFLVNYDNYYRTHSKENHEISSYMYEKAKENGYIKTETISQLYDPEKNMFLPDRFVKGTCPKCGAKDQYGDNCEVCGATYSPTELKDAYSVVSGAKPVLKESLHYFFDLPKAKDFLQKAFTVIFIATIVVWFLQSFDLKLNLVEDSANSMLAMVSGLLVPLFRPLGLGDWRICTSLISGFMAKESVVATLEVLFGSSIATVLTPLAAATLLVFSLLYTPCVAAIASVRRELGGKWAIAVVLWQCFVAWVAAFLVHGIGLLMGF